MGICSGSRRSGYGKLRAWQPGPPYVTGSVFHSGSGKGGDKDNKVKSIITRSGNAIVFDDETGSIVITDQTGKQLIMLDGTDAITVMAKKSITLTNEAESVIVMDDKSIACRPIPLLSKAGKV